MGCPLSGLCADNWNVIGWKPIKRWEGNGCWIIIRQGEAFDNEMGHFFFVKIWCASQCKYFLFFFIPLLKKTPHGDNWCNSDCSKIYNTIMHLNADFKNIVITYVGRPSSRMLCIHNDKFLWAKDTSCAVTRMPSVSFCDKVGMCRREMGNSSYVHLIWAILIIPWICCCIRL